jgi:hypothetical protein
MPAPYPDSQSYPNNKVLKDATIASGQTKSAAIRSTSWTWWASTFRGAWRRG